jgi:hypothetical protein
VFCKSEIGMPGNVVPQFLLATEHKIKSHKKELEKMYSTEYFREQINGDLAEKFVDGKTLKQFIETEDRAYSSTLELYSVWKTNNVAKRSLVAEREENYQYNYYALSEALSDRNLGRAFHCGPLCLDAVLKSVESLRPEEKRKHALEARSVKESKSSLDFWTELVVWAGSVFAELDAEAVDQTNVAYKPGPSSQQPTVLFKQTRFPDRGLKSRQNQAPLMAKKRY